MGSQTDQISVCCVDVIIRAKHSVFWDYRINKDGSKDWTLPGGRSFVSRPPDRWSTPSAARQADADETRTDCTPRNSGRLADSGKDRGHNDSDVFNAANEPTGSEACNDASEFSCSDQGLRPDGSAAFNESVSLDGPAEGPTERHHSANRPLTHVSARFAPKPAPTTRDVQQKEDETYVARIAELRIQKRLARARHRSGVSGRDIDADNRATFEHTKLELASHYADRQRLLRSRIDPDYPPF